MAVPKASAEAEASPSPNAQSPDVLRRDATASPLHQLVREQLETFLARFEDDHGGRRLPRYVEEELRGFLACGDPPYGFCRIHCPGCASDLLVPFSCKGRAFCPSCGGRRMAEVAAHLVDRVLPTAPIRQWVLSVPWALRLRMACDPSLCRAVARAFLKQQHKADACLNREVWASKVTKGLHGPEVPKAVESIEAATASLSWLGVTRNDVVNLVVRVRKSEGVSTPPLPFPPHDVK